MYPMARTLYSSSIKLLVIFLHIPAIFNLSFLSALMGSLFSLLLLVMWISQYHLTFSIGLVSSNSFFCSCHPGKLNCPVLPYCFMFVTTSHHTSHLESRYLLTFHLSLVSLLHFSCVYHTASHRGDIL